MPERVDTDIDQQQYLAGCTGHEQLVVADLGQRQFNTLLQGTEQVEQLELAQVTGARMQRHAGRGVDHVVAVAPGQQLKQFPAALDRRKVRPLVNTQVAVVQGPLMLAWLAFIRGMHQRQRIFCKVRSDARIDELDLARLALESGIQAPTEYGQVTSIERVGGALRAGEPGLKAIAVIELVNQCTTLAGHLAHFPLAAAVEQRQLSFIPAPLRGQALQQQALPTGVALTARAGELFVDLQVQAAPHQFEALLLVACLQMLFDTPVHNHVRVQLIQVQLVGKHRLLETQAQALHAGMFTGVNLDQQQLENRLVGRLDTLEQLPQAGTDKFRRRNVRHRPEVEHFAGADEAFAQQGMGVILIVLLFIDWHQPPHRGAPCEPDRRAIKLIEQQVMLGSAAVVRAELRVAVPTLETLRVDQEKVRLCPHSGGPGFKGLAFPAQFGDGLRLQFAVVADPYVHVALFSLGQRTEAAHQEQAVNRLGSVTTPDLVREGACQALRFGQRQRVRFVLRDASRRATGNVTGQQRVVDVKEQRQQGQNALLAGRHAFEGTRISPVIERQETVAQLAENLAVDALIQVGANFRITRHRNSRHLACAGVELLSKDGGEGLQPREKDSVGLLF
ncbi:hypothetical protein ALP03_05855 [Pseudomonas amygdali pv. tabaci]|uniref:Uncharacterized protein n=1 Tax=Pseudomonas amygdali pv. tabaci TaxID=322 RepID=A0A3M6G170_PSEAJ|nr:hypothetical protein ALP03_05855 [Pseudomonas amygdali pv. tabaci]